jgi:hypothetical protein
MRPLILTLLAAATVAAAPAASTARERLSPDRPLDKLLAGRVAGEPRDCIPLTFVTSSQIIDKTAIVYRIGGTLWVNRPDGAETLDDDDILVTKLTTSQLCSIDTVQLRDRSSHMFSGFVGLNQFVPYRRAKAQ